MTTTFTLIQKLIRDYCYLSLLTNMVFGDMKFSTVTLYRVDDRVWAFHKGKYLYRAHLLFGCFGFDQSVVDSTNKNQLNPNKTGSCLVRWNTHEMLPSINGTIKAITKKQLEDISLASLTTLGLSNRANHSWLKCLGTNVSHLLLFTLTLYGQCR